MIKFKSIKPTADITTPVTSKEPDPGPVAEAFKIKDFPQNHLLYHIHKNTAKETAPRHHNVVHSSDLDPARHWCPREPALLTKHNKKRPKGFLSTAMHMVFQMGYKGADLVMEVLPRERIWGNWKCLACKQEVKYVYAPKCCPFCEAHPRALEYKEVFMRDPDTGVVGSCDLFYDVLGNGRKTLIEIKTEGNDSFKSRSKPEFDHEWRTTLYLHIASKNWNGDFAAKYNINLDDARIVYVTKEGFDAAPQIKEWGIADWAKSSMKEYWVNRNDEMIEPRLDLAMEYRSWRNGWDDGNPPVLMPDRIDKCTSPNCTRAKECPVKKECWG